MKGNSVFMLSILFVIFLGAMNIYCELSPTNPVVNALYNNQNPKNTGFMLIGQEETYQVESYPFVLTWGSYGTGFGQFRTPMGIAVGSSGDIHVSQIDSPCRVQRFTPNGVFVSTFGTCGSNIPPDGQFNYLTDIGIDNFGNIYTLEVYSSRVQKFTANGVFIAKWGSYGPADGQFDRPTVLAVDENNNIYVCDRYNNRIQKFDSNGNFIAKWPMTDPRSVSSDKRGGIYVVVGGSNSVKKYNPSGVLLGSFGSTGNGDGQFDHPRKTATDSNGNIYVVDSYNHRVQVFSPSFDFIGKFGSFGIDPGKFYGPGGIAVDNLNNIYVVDTNNSRVQKFRISSPTEPDPTLSTIPNVIACPDGSLTYKVIVNSSVGPVAGAAVRLEFSSEAEAYLFWCPSQTHPTISTVTNASGEALFTIAAGGCMNPTAYATKPVNVYVNNILFKGVGVVSPDNTADGRVTTIDIVNNTNAYRTGAYNYCADLNSDNICSTADMVIFTPSAKQGVICR